MSLGVCRSCQVTGTSKEIKLSANVVRLISLPCGCHVASCHSFQRSKASIGGKEFSAGEKLIAGRRCGSVVTSAKSGRSMYGLVKQFVRVMCACLRFYDFAVVTWFPRPTYPDGVPLTV